MMRYKDFADLIDRMAASSPARPALLTCGNDGLKQAIKVRFKNKKEPDYR